MFLKISRDSSAIFCASVREIVLSKYEFIEKERFEVSIWMQLEFKVGTTIMNFQSNFSINTPSW